jgi:hypothetical protein
MGEGRGYRVLVGRCKGKRPLGRPRHKCKDNIKLDLREIEIDGAKQIWLAQDMVQWQAFGHNNEPLGSIRKQDIFDKLSDNQLFE